MSHSFEVVALIHTPPPEEQSPIKPSQLVEDITPSNWESIQSTPPSDYFKTTPKRVYKRQLKTPETVIDLSDQDNEPSHKKFITPEFQIPTSSFYSKPNKSESVQVEKLPEKKQATKRKPSSVAHTTRATRKKIVNDEKTGVFDFLPNQPVSKKKRSPPKRKRTEAVVGPLITIPFRRNESKRPRKLYDQNADVIDVDLYDDQMEKVPRMNVPDSTYDLTTDTFRSVFIHDKSEQNKRVFDNMSKINEKAEKKNEIPRAEASFSYRKASLTTKALADSTVSLDVS